MKRYSVAYKKSVVEAIKNESLSTVGTAREEGIPLKTLEKWITAYNKDPNCFDVKKENLNDEIKAIRKRIANLKRQKKAEQKLLEEKLQEKRSLK